jgi:hypothetical protein
MLLVCSPGATVQVGASPKIVLSGPACFAATCSSVITAIRFPARPNWAIRACTSRPTSSPKTIG